MPSEREKMEGWTKRQVFDSLSNSEPGTPTHTRAVAEIRRRSMEVDQASLEAQQKSADAAKSSRLSARYALGAAIVAAISLVASIISIFHFRGTGH
jgi:hypothetical protein